jgi:hypothetical protein
MVHALVQMTGTTPLVMHNIRLADKDDDFARQIAVINKKRSKTEADYAQIAHLEFLGGLYWDPTVGLHVPTFNVLRSWEMGGTLTKQGKALIQSVAITTELTPIEYEGPRKPEELWQQEAFRFRRLVRVQRATVTRMRPIFRRWAASLEVEVEEAALDPDAFVRVVETAGKVAGLGDARKLGYGRFAAEVALERTK